MKLETIKVAGTEAIQRLEQLRADYPTTGVYPFLIGDHRDLYRIQEATEDDEEFDPSRIITASLKVNVAEWLAARRVESGGSDDLLGKWPRKAIPKGSMGIHKDVLTGQAKKDVYLGLTEIAEPWHVPAVLNYGAWNECPAAEVHCAFHREWQAKYGAEITGMSGDVVECVVTRPPADRDAAIQLAWEQYWYCTDIVEQGCRTVSKLAATLLDSPYWYFWWD